MGDDVVFFIFLYQRYIYKIDPTRVNEYGVSAEMLEKKEVEGSVDTSAAPAIEGCDPVGDEGVQEAPKAKPKSKKAKKVGLDIFCCLYGSDHRDYVMMACITSKSLVDSS